MHKMPVKNNMETKTHNERGAGRKPDSELGKKITVSFRISPEAHEKLKGVRNKSEFVNLAILDRQIGDLG